MAIMPGLLTLPLPGQNKTDQANVYLGPELNDKIDGYPVEIAEDGKDAVYMTMTLKQRLHLHKLP